MFVEPSFSKKNVGWIEVVCGGMFSGKTEELIRRLRRATIAGQTVEIFKPTIDIRYHETDVVSHNESTIRSTPVHFAQEIWLIATKCDVVGIDEAQFFDDELINVVKKLAESGKRVIVAGLDMDFLGNPFGTIPQLMAMAEYVTKLQAVCMQCGEPASFSYRKVAAQNTILLGEKDQYEARCRRCFTQKL